jgi:hypothetical protein
MIMELLADTRHKTKRRPCFKQSRRLRSSIRVGR